MTLRLIVSGERRVLADGGGARESVGLVSRPEAEHELREGRRQDQHQEAHDRDRRALSHRRSSQVGDVSGGTSVTATPARSSNSAAADVRSMASAINP